MATVSAPLVRTLAAEGGVVLGKALMSELDLGSTGNTIAYGLVHNVSEG